MSTFVRFLLLALTVSFTAFTVPTPQSGKKDRPTKLARYEVGAYIAGAGTKLRVNVDKQPGGQVSVQLIDRRGTLYFDRTLTQEETMARLSLDLTELIDGDYQLKISNGLEMEVREIKVSTRKPTTVSRSITVLQ